MGNRVYFRGHGSALLFVALQFLLLAIALKLRSLHFTQ